jgi:hypothetical protein
MASRLHLKTKAAKAARKGQNTKDHNHAIQTILRAPAQRQFPRRVYRTPTDQRIWGADLLDMSKAPGTLRSFALVTVDYLTHYNAHNQMMDRKVGAVLRKAVDDLASVNGHDAK